ncbi:AAA family ATPase [Nostoc parmelioides]|uniref:MoxR family ATPase n=1 Tax=Nostoc parmelioides FACHB-3921 TaxID=2692909 RepID=A0ABR8BDK7_9NOSO|nr:MoxR family ATPase [Nostoc parmelioides]MBD2251799.1 MoxR family ATPase [Nostoc parmelioides FACHB-3921]
MAEAISNNHIPEYTGKIQPTLGERGANGQLLYPYLPSPELIEVVNLAIYLKRPLLLKGEPGCGKTQLANAVAYELGLNLEAWYVKSTSRAKDGLYSYDAVGRLRDAQLAASGLLSPEKVQKIDEPSAYVRWGPLGRAFLQEKPTVVLIDEIDKADIDFPNDLLLELDERRFIVEETGEQVEAKSESLVFITSNDEKDLPDAFLRRCLFHYVEFPSMKRLVEIINNHFPVSPEPVVNKALERFMELRDEMKKDKGDASKRVSTSELIDWFRVLRRYPQDEILEKLNGQLPYPGVLLKSWDDHRRFLANTSTNS